MSIFTGWIKKYEPHVALRIISVLLIILIVVRSVFHDDLAKRLDPVFFWLLTISILVFFISIPNYTKNLVIFALHILSLFKSIGKGEVNQDKIQALLQQLAATNKILMADDEEVRVMGHFDPEQMEGRFSKLREDIAKVRNSRILWLDDNPHKILQERRILRVWGVEIVSAKSSDKAEEILEVDNDFDLLITDVQREGKSYEVTGGNEIHEGVNFIVKLRNHYPDQVVRSIPVVFYAAYDWERLVKFTQPARELLPEPDISNTVEDFLVKVIQRLADSHTAPKIVDAPKRPTSIHG
jgi:CheY-like chemotaxis protein